MKIINFSNSNSILSTYIREIRDVKIHNDRLRFRRNIERIGEIMAYEISKVLKYKTVNIDTPLENTDAIDLDENVVIATILRAGIPFHHGVLNFFDNAENAFVSAFRKYTGEGHSNFDIHVEYIASPPITGKTLILTDPMLATGGSMHLSYQALLTKGEPSKIHIVSIISSQQAIDYCKSVFPQEKTTIWTAAIDPQIDNASYILPGLGDAGDLAYGAKE